MLVGIDGKVHAYCECVLCQNSPLYEKIIFSYNGQDLENALEIINNNFVKVGGKTIHKCCYVLMSKKVQKCEEFTKEFFVNFLCGKHYFDEKEYLSNIQKNDGKIIYKCIRKNYSHPEVVEEREL